MKIDERITTLADNLLTHSVAIKPGEIVYIDLVGNETLELAQECIRIATLKGAIPFWNSFDDRLSKPFFKQANDEQNSAFANLHQSIMQQVDAYIGIRAQQNPYQMGDLSAKAKQLQRRYFWNVVHSETRLKKKWVVLRYPNPAMSILANRSIEDFEDFYFNVCNLDYNQMSKAMDPLIELMDQTDRVKITSPGTDIEFSIKGISTIKCDGKMNIPDGEVYTAPVKDSVNGRISYNTTTFYNGVLFRDVQLEVMEGKIIKATASNDQDKIDEIFNTDEGARYFGEFAIGVHPHILHPLNDTLFDEKICGSIHLTPGSSYDDAFNGNKSSVHWDMVLIQRGDYGGGEIYFDDKLIRKDGRFVLESLQGLNPENLAS